MSLTALAQTQTASAAFLALQNGLQTAFTLPVSVESAASNLTTPCATITSNTRFNPTKQNNTGKREWLINFDATCKGPNGYTRSGSIAVVALFTTGNGPHTEVQVTFNQYSNGQGLILNGTVTGIRTDATSWNLSGDAVRLSNAKTNETAAISLTEKLSVSLGMPNNVTDDVFYFSGITKFDYSAQPDLLLNIGRPLKFTAVCQNGYPVMGVFEMTESNGVLQLDFSPDQQACDTKLSCKLGSAKPMSCSLDNLPRPK